MQGTGSGVVTRAARLAVLVAFGIAALAQCSVAQAGPAAEKEAIPERVARPLAQASEAFRAEEWRRAEVLFHTVSKQEPGLRQARFGRGYALAKLGRGQEARDELERYLGDNPSVGQLVACGAILQGSPARQSEALAEPYFRRALDTALAQQYPESTDFEKLDIVAALAFPLQRFDVFDRAVAALTKLYPNRARTHLYLALQKARGGHWADAKTERQRAISLGMSAFEADGLLRAAGFDLNPSPWTYARYTALAAVAAAVGLVVLFLAGKILSALTLRAAETGDPNLPITAQQAALRKIYRLVVNIAGLYYYICLPFVILVALLIVAALFFVMLRMRYVSGKGLAVLAGFGFAMLAMIWASVKSLFVRIKDEDPGRKLGEDEAPALWAVVRDVAATVGTRPVDEIWLTDGTELGVLERGGWWSKLRDRSRRALILGEGVLDGFRVDAFRAVLAHEYGHFLHRDTAGGDVALRVNATMSRFATAMAEQGNLQWWNVGWQFLRVYHYVFRRITHGASRLQEINADRVAGRISGKDAFEAGLRHVIRRDIAHSIETVQAVHNLERLAAEVAPEPWGKPYRRAEFRHQIDHQFAEIWERGTTEDDTHPSPVERIRLLAPLNAAGATCCDNRATQYVEDLFANPAQRRTERAERQAEMLKEFVTHKRAQLTEVVGQIDAYLSEHPGLTNPVVQRGQVRFELNDFAGAEADFSEAIRLDGPNPATAYLGRGCARVELGDVEGAIADFRKVLELDPALAPQARGELADALFQAGRGEEAAAEYTALIAQTPDTLNLFLRRGDALTQHGDFAGAEADYDRALTLAPRCAEALAARALARATLGKLGEAETDARAALAIEPSLAAAPGMSRFVGAAATAPQPR